MTSQTKNSSAMKVEPPVTAEDVARLNSQITSARASGRGNRLGAKVSTAAAAAERAGTLSPPGGDSGRASESIVEAALVITAAN